MWTALAVAIVATNSLGLRAQEYEAGVISTNHQWLQVDFETPFAAPPVVVAGPAEYNGPHPATVRVRNVTASGFEIRIDEWNYLDGPHTNESISYFALPEGIHSIGGLTWEAGRVAGVTEGFQNVSLSAPFDAPPVVAAQIETVNNLDGGSDPAGLVNRIDDVTAGGFRLRIQDEEGAIDSAAGEGVAYLAVSEGEGYLGSQPVMVTRTGPVVNGRDDDGNGRIDPFTVAFARSFENAVFVADYQTQRGGNTVSLRHDSLQADSVDVFVEEETSGDDEVWHTEEDIGMIVIGERRGLDEAKIEAGELTRNQADGGTWYTVNLSHTYDELVVVMGPPSRHGRDPSTMRVRNVTADSFEYQLDEWDYLDGPHTTTTHHFIAMEAGVYETDGGLVWQAGVAEGIDGQEGGFQTVDFPGQFRVPPVVLAQCAGVNDPDAVSTRVRRVTRTSFQTRLEEQYANRQAGDPHAGEPVHYVAIQPGPSSYTAGGTLYLFDVAATGETISDEGANSESQVDADGIDFGFETVPFPRTYDAAPMLVGCMQTVNGGDTAALRHRSLGASSFDVRVEEEQSSELEVNHVNEVVGYVAASTYADADGDGLPDDWESTHGVTDAGGDADADGMSNAEEFWNDSDPNAEDITQIAALTEEMRGFEKGGHTASFALERSGTLQPMTVFFDLGGAATPDSPVASAGEYDVRDQDGLELSGMVTLPRFVDRAEVVIHPSNDALHEYPERVEMTVLSSSDYEVAGGGGQAEVDIADARDTAANETLFVGYFVPEGNAETGGSGVTTLVMNGSNTEARISTSFSGLTSPQTNSHVHKADPGPVSGPIMHQLPMTGELQNYPWTLAPAGSGLYTVERLVDSLYGQNGETKLYVNVHTENYGSGEIWALLDEAEGSVDPPPAPEDPPAIESFDLSTAEGRRKLRRDIARFLTQATFGPTQQSIEQLYEAVDAHPGDDRIAVYDQWIDDQFALDQTLHADYVVAADWQEWVLRKHFDYPLSYYDQDNDGDGDVDQDDLDLISPPEPDEPASWPVLTGDPSTFDSLDPTTWRMPSGPFPLRGGQINNRREFAPNLGHPNYHHRRRASWTIWANGHDQLRQRMGFAWEEILVASANLGRIRTRHLGAARWIDMLAENADDTYRELIEDVTYSPVMGKYLSSLQNASLASTGVPPDENYAREIMQLFSIGLVRLWQDGSLRVEDGSGLVEPTYDNDDITEMARVLTGLSFSRHAGPNQWDDPRVNDRTNPNNIGNRFNRGARSRFYGATYEYPMHMFGTFHDLGVKIVNPGSDTELVVDNTGMSDGDLSDPTDENAHGEADIADVHDWLAGHPNTAPFISYRLIQRLVTSNPSRGYVHRVAETFSNTGGDLAAVTKAILLDYEARSLELTDEKSYGKMKEPLVRYLQAIRAFNAASEISVDGSGLAGSDLTEFGYPVTQADNFTGTIDYTSADPLDPANNLPGTRYRYPNTDDELGQTPLRAPSVFNWFLPGYSPDGPISNAALVAPEFQITNETSVIAATNYFWNLSWRINGQYTHYLGTVHRQNVSPPFTPQEDLGYDNLSQRVKADFDAWVAKYDGYSGSEAERDQALIDELDLLLTAGSLAARYPVHPNDGDVNPREILIDVLTQSFGTGSFNQKRNKVRTAFYLLTTSSDYIIQQ